MKKLMKWLEEHNIEFTINKGYIVVTLESNCIWVNGFGEDMVYDKKIRIYQDTYKNYVITEVTGYMMVATLFKGTKADNAIKILSKRFNK